MESGYVANDIDLASQSGWWLQPNSLPPQLQGRKDIFFESEESTSSKRGGKTTVTRDIYVLFQDYSQTALPWIITGAILILSPTEIFKSFQTPRLV